MKTAMDMPKVLENGISPEKENFLFLFFFLFSCFFDLLFFLLYF